MTAIKFLVVFFLISIPALVYGHRSQQGKLTSLFNEHASSVIHEKIFVHLDRSDYLTGETIWFKANVVDGMLHRSLLMSKVMYVEIIDKTQRAVLQMTVPIDSLGHASGSIQLENSLSSGTYLFRAYTRWMKNFSDHYFFNKELTVINPFIELDKPQDVSNKIDIKFFPEGGNLINGLETKVAFQAVNNLGRGTNVSGMIVNEEADTIARFNALRDGIGNFVITPRKGERYSVVFDDGQLVSERTLPLLPEDRGFAMSVNGETEERIQVKVTTLQDKSDSDELVYLLVHTRRRLVLARASQLMEGKAIFLVDKNELDEGVSHFTVFDMELTPKCERLYFKPVSAQMHIGVTLSSEKFSNRDKVSIRISTMDESRKPCPSHLSLSVFRSDSQYNDPAIDIVGYLYGLSDLNGLIESPSYYFSGDIDSVKSVAIDNLMLTHGWRRFKWQDILSKRNELSYIPEIHGHIVEGTVKNSEDGLPRKDLNLFISAPGERFQFAIPKTSKTGRFFFDLVNHDRIQRVLVQSREHDNVAVELKNPFSTGRAFSPRPLTLSDGNIDQIAERSVHLQMQRLFDKTKVMPPNHSQFIPFYGNATNRYRLDDYVRFSTMEETLREYIPEVIVRKKKDGFHLMVENSIFDKKVFFEGAPLIFIDGMPIFNSQTLMDVNPLEIESIDIVARQYYLGNLAFDGVLSVKSKHGFVIENVDVNPSTLATYYFQGHTQREFYSPSYETQARKVSNIPDARTLLYWVPNLETDRDGNATLEFYTSDISGTYQIIINGHHPNGLIGTSSTTFVVERAK